jgi:putative flippase GtrA
MTSFALATLLNCVLSIRLVFQSGARFSRKHHEVALVLLVGLVGLAINQSVLWACIDKARIELLIAKTIGTEMIFPRNYFSRRYIVFKPAMPAR